MIRDHLFGSCVQKLKKTSFFLFYKNRSNDLACPTSTDKNKRELPSVMSVPPDRDYYNGKLT